MRNFFTFITVVLIICLSITQAQPPVAVNDTFDINRLDDTVTFNLRANDYSQNGHPFFIFAAQGSISHTDSTATYFLSHDLYFFKDGIYEFKNYIILDTINDPDLFEMGTIYLHFHNPYYDTLDINKVRARINNNGNHFWDLQGQNLYNVPKGSNEDALFCYATWIGGLDANDQLHVAADRYGDGQDFFTGPISTPSFYDKAYDSLWNRVWKINKTDIDYHKLHWGDAGYQAPEAILSWPGNGNTSMGQMAQQAPYYDNNSNGVYEPMTGDYPLIKGDQAVFFIQNDSRRPHTATQGEPLGIEIHGMAYAFNCTDDSALLYTTFLHYDVYNRSTMTYHDTYMGSFVDTELGNAWDDFVGCDIPRGSFYSYDGVQQPSYASAISTTYLGGPYLDPDNLDNPKTDEFGNPLCNNSINGANFQDGIIDNERYGMNSFVYFNNCGSGPTCDPQNAGEYYGLLRSIWRDGVHMKYGANGHPNSGSTDVDCRFMFPELSDFCNWGTDGIQPPGYVTGAGGSGTIWTEAGVGNMPDDRRGAVSNGPFTFNPGAKQELDIAFVWARDWTGNQPWDAVVLMKSRIDQVRYYYQHDTTPCGGTFTGISRNNPPQKSLNIYPNPANDMLYIAYDNIFGNAVYSIYGLAGNLVTNSKLSTGNLSQVSLNTLKPGMYLLVLRDGNYITNKKFIKN